MLHLDAEVVLLLEVRPDPVAEDTGLADIEDASLRIAHQVDTGLGGDQALAGLEVGDGHQAGTARFVRCIAGQGGGCWVHGVNALGGAWPAPLPEIGRRLGWPVLMPQTGRRFACLTRTHRLLRVCPRGHRARRIRGNRTARLARRHFVVVGPGSNRGSCPVHTAHDGLQTNGFGRSVPILADR